MISNSLMPKYYGVPEEFKDRFLFLEDYCKAKIANGSPLPNWFDGKVGELKRHGISLPLDAEIFVGFQILNAILVNPDWHIYVEPTRVFEVKIPIKWDKILKNMHKSPNNDLKTNVIDYIFRTYILYQSLPQNDYENYLYEEISRVINPI